MRKNHYKEHILKNMKFIYPRISNALTYKESDDGIVDVYNCLSGAEYEFTCDAAEYIKQLDGYTPPFEIKTSLEQYEIKELLEWLEENSLIRYEWSSAMSLGLKARALWIPDWDVFSKLLAYFANGILVILWLPVLILGIVMFVGKNGYESGTVNIFGTLVGALLGMVLHEFGHAFAGVSFGANVFEIGILTLLGIPIGAYAGVDERFVKKRSSRIQIFAAGVEMNFLIMGLFLILAASFPDEASFCLSAALTNGFLALVNLMPADGLDGASILFELLGGSNVSAGIKKIVSDKKERRRMAKRGAFGYAVIAVSYICRLMYYAFFLIHALILLEVVICVFSIFFA